MKYDDFGLDLKKILVNKNEIEVSARPIITTIVLSALNKCTSAVNPTSGMIQGCCNRNVEKIETKGKLCC